MSDRLPLFVYGTLQDADVLRRVTGLELAHLQPRPAALSGYLVERAEGFTYPILVKRTGAAAAGLLLPPLGAAAIDKLIAYETAAYALEQVICRCADRNEDALVFMPRTSRLQGSGQAWNLTDWQSHHKTAFIDALVRQAPF